MARPSNAGSLVGQRMGKFEVLALLAMGGTAEIYLARIGGEAGFQKYVVIKCLLDHLADDTDFVRMFLDEARLGAQLHHSNIVQTLELGQHGHRYYMVMEYLAGLSLAQLARKAQDRIPGRRLPTHIVLALAAQACSGLHYAHQRTSPDGVALNIVHRDVSPQNLVVSFDGVLKIVDFGIAKAELRQTHTRSGTIKGKFAYMSPEQCQAEPIDRRTDIFALGTILHEVLTARRLFKRPNTYETYQAITKGNVPPPSRLNPEIDDEIDYVVLKALAYHREDRFQTAEALGEALLGLLHRRGTSVSSGDVSRLFDEHFGPELEEHGQRMRELIAGGPITRSVEISWSAEGESSRRPTDDDSFGEGDDDDDDGPIDPPVAGDDADLGSADRPRAVRARNEHERNDFGGDTHVELDPDGRIAAIHFESPREVAARQRPRARTTAAADDADAVEGEVPTSPTLQLSDVSLLQRATTRTPPPWAVAPPRALAPLPPAGPLADTIEQRPRRTPIGIGSTPGVTADPLAETADGAPLDGPPSLPPPPSPLLAAGPPPAGARPPTAELTPLPESPPSPTAGEEAETLAAAPAYPMTPVAERPTVLAPPSRPGERVILRPPTQPERPPSLAVLLVAFVLSAGLGFGLTALLANLL